MESRGLNIRHPDFEQGLKKFIFSLNIAKEEGNDVQETFLKLVNNRAAYKMDEYLGALSNSLKKKAFINTYKRVLLQIPNVEPVDKLFLLHLADNDPDTSEVYDRIIRNIEKLDPKLRKPFKLYIEGYDYKEITLRLKLKLKTIQNRILMARIKLILMDD